MLGTIGIGVVSGVITSVLILLAEKVFHEIILPWYQEKVYQGVSIDGNWSGSTTISKREWFIRLRIDQKGSKVIGEFEAYRDCSASKKETEMTFEGRIYDGFVIINCISKNHRKLSFGAMLLRVRNETMVGKQIFRDLSDSMYDVFESKVMLHYEAGNILYNNKFLLRRE